MASKIVNYKRKKTINEEITEKSFAMGETILLEPSDESPFIADIPLGKTVRSFDNNLFRAPVVRHSSHNSHHNNNSFVDFLLIKSKDGLFFIILIYFNFII